MGSTGFLARAQLRRRWRALVALAVLVGVIGGVAIALIAGSRRSASVVERYFAAGTQYDLQVGQTCLTREELLDLPEVVRADPSAYVGMVRVAPDGTVADGINASSPTGRRSTRRPGCSTVQCPTAPTRTRSSSTRPSSASTTAPSATLSTYACLGRPARAGRSRRLQGHWASLHLPHRGHCPDAHRHRR